MEITKEFFEEWNDTDSTLQSDLPSHLTAEMKGYDQRNGYNAVGRWVVHYKTKFGTEEIGMISGGENIGYKILSHMNPDWITGKNSSEDFACDILHKVFEGYLYSKNPVH